MRTKVASIILGILLAAQSAYSADVAYHLDEESLPLYEAPTAAEPGAIAIVDREWAAPGVEQFCRDGRDENTGRSRPRKEVPQSCFEQSGRQRFRIEAAPGSQFPVTQTEYVIEAIPSFAEDAWPLTRRLFGFREEHIFSMIVCQDAFPNLQR